MGEADDDALACPECGESAGASALVCDACHAPLPSRRPAFTLGEDPLAAITNASVLRSRARPQTVEMDAPPVFDGDLAAVGTPQSSAAGPPALGPRRSSTIQPTMEIGAVAAAGALVESAEASTVAPQPGAAQASAPRSAASKARATMAMDSVDEPPPTAEVGVAETVETDPPTPTRRREPHIGRALPLGIVGGVAVGAAVAATLMTLNQEPEPAQAGAVAEVEVNDELELATILLDPIEATIGMTDDNKEQWLAACIRVADNPNATCRTSALQESGEYPARTVAFDAVRADVYEVSNAAFDACVREGACGERDIERCRLRSLRGFEFGADIPERMLAPHHPAVCLTYEDAEDVCAWREMEVPTADMWERLARSGQATLYPWRGNFWAPGILNWGERDMTGYPIAGRLDGAEFTNRVDAYPDGATSEGLRNLMGNVAEWVQPGPLDEGEGHAGIRGGSYADDVRTLRVTRHESVPQSQRRSDVGVRCVASAE